MESDQATDESSTDEFVAAQGAQLQMAAAGGFSVESSRSPLEREADLAADAVIRGRSATVTGRLLGPTRLARKPAKTKKKGPPQICGRASTRMADYPLTYISDVNVDVTSPKHSLTLAWTGPGAGSGLTGSFHTSPGAGNCGVDCDDTKTSQTSDTHCTPKDGSWTVNGTGCSMAPKYPDAKNVTYFQRSGIALHFYPSVPDYPASHGCVRIESLRASQVIHDNCLPGKTNVNVTGTWTRGTHPTSGKPVCW